MTRLGVLLLCVAVLVFAARYLWLQTRTLEALDEPVVFTSGQFTSTPFRVNVDQRYFMELYYDRPAASCAPATCPAPQFSWTVTRNGEAAVTGTSRDNGNSLRESRTGRPGREIDYFQAESGEDYTVSLKVAGSESAGSNPRLVVRISAGYIKTLGVQNLFLMLACLLAAFFGAVLVYAGLRPMRRQAPVFFGQPER